MCACVCLCVPPCAAHPQRVQTQPPGKFFKSPLAPPSAAPAGALRTSSHPGWKGIGEVLKFPVGKCPWGLTCVQKERGVRGISGGIGGFWGESGGGAGMGWPLFSARHVLPLGRGWKGVCGGHSITAPCAHECAGSLTSDGAFTSVVDRKSCFPQLIYA